MGGAARRAGLAALIALLALPASAPARGVGIHWERYLPDMPPIGGPQGHAVPGCRRAALACIDGEVRHLARIQQRYGCDHRGVFATTYLELTRALRSAVATGRVRFLDPRYLYFEDALFADVYFGTLRSWSGGRPIAPAWRIALQTARSAEVNAAQDMLLGINAHVQNDMPFVLAALGLRLRDGRSRKPDHDIVNDVLDAAYQRVIDAVRRRFDPVLDFTNPSWTDGDDVAGLEMVRGWREGVWRNAERLLAASSEAERAQVADQIRQNAAVWAQAIAATPQPGYRATRDAYCAGVLGGGA
jgi:hypothetical protein